MRTYFLSSTTLLVTSLLFFASCKKSSSNNSNNNSNGNTDSATTIYSTTIAGNTAASSFDFGPTGVAVDATGNVFASIDGDGIIVKIGTSGAISTFAGSKGNFGCEAGTGAAATFTNPYSICTDPQGNIYVADYLCDGIKKITPGGVSTKFCSSDGANNVSIFPQTLCIDAQGNIYSADQLGQDGISKTTPGGVVSRFAGSITTTGFLDGPASSAEFNGLGITGLCSDAQGNIYVADPPRIRKISNGQVTTVAGNATNGFSDGKGTAATFGGVMGICMGPDGNVYIADVYNNSIRMMTPGGTVTTVTGNGSEGIQDGDPKTAQFNQPANLCFDSKGNLYVADWGNRLVRKITFPK